VKVGAFLLACCGTVAACFVYTPDLVDPLPSGAGGAASSSTGSVVSVGQGGQACPGGKCTCGNGMTDADETDVDCGGAKCSPCTDGKKCAQPSDCLSEVCMTTCQVPSCTDVAKNGDETGVDCGGSCMAKCADGLGCTMGSDCQSGVCQALVCQPPKCGDKIKAGMEACDDGSMEPFGHDCSCTCQLPVGHLILSELVVAPSAGEAIEIYNPTSAPVDLEHYWLADYKDYYLITGGGKPISSDFLMHFPAGAKIDPGQFVIVSLHSATEYKNTYTIFPDYDCDGADPGAPNMLGTIGSSAGLTDGGEMVVLFRWDGVSATVSDVDYLPYGTPGANDRIDKTGQTGYQADIPAAQQIAAKAPSSGKSLHRCPTSEDSEAKMSGNGITGHDETSENGALSWKIIAKPTPNAPPPAGTCP
jgi:hypothetical protein